MADGRKKKIVIIGPAYPYRGGNSLFVSHLYAMLKERFDTVIYNYKLLYPSFLFPGTTQYDNSDTIIRKAPSIRAVNSVNPFNWFSVARAIRAEKADLVIVDWWHPFFAPCHGTITSLLKKYYAGRILFITENYISHEGSPVDRLLTKIGLRNASHFLALSDKVVREIREDFPARPVLKAELPIYDCYQGGSAASVRKEFGFEDHHKVLLFFGYIRKYKGLDILIRAMKQIIRADSTVRLLAVGESYEDISLYKNIIAEEGLQDYVRLENVFVANEDVWKYYSIADVVMLPYRSATQSGILNIAYGFLKPVIVTNVGGLGEFVEDGKTGLIIQPESEEAIAAAVERFFAMRNSVPFEEHIRGKLKENLFYTIPDLLDEILT